MQATSDQWQTIEGIFVPFPTFFGNLLVSQITKEKVEEFKLVRRERITFKGKPVSHATCNRELACLRHILKLAVEEGIIESAPIVRLYKEHNAGERALSEEESQQLLDASPLHLRRILICAYETGMRAGEIKGLTWDKVDLKAGFIRLAAEDTKTSEKRAIPLPSLLQETLEAIREEHRNSKVAPIGGHVFTWASNERRMETRVPYCLSQGWLRGLSLP